MMWWEPDMLHAEIDIRTPEDRHRGACGEPGTPWGTLAVTPDNRRHQISVHAWTPATWERLLAAADTNFRKLGVELSDISEHGTVGGGELVKLTVERDHPGYQGWTRLEALLTPRPADDARWGRLPNCGRPS